MRRILYILVLICLTNFVKGQVYQSMPQYGYGPVKRMDFDSSLTIPTTCGVPTLRTYLTKKAAIAYDSCNKRLYYYDPKLMAWDTIKGGGSGTTIDTTSLSSRIDARVKYIDTSAMLSPYLRKIDTTEKFINRIEQVNGWDSIRYYIGDTFYHVRTGMDTSRVLIAKVHNAEATTLTRGTAVYLSGATGDVASVRRANNKHDSTSARTLGLVREDIAAGEIGYVITKGQITKLNLGAFNAGDFIYLDSIDGQFTKNKPKAPFHYVPLGIVERANAGNGLAYLNPMNGFETEEIHDIQINNITNNQILVYSDTQGVWKNRSVYSVVDTTKLSSRIDARVKYIDTSAMLSPYLRKIDTASVSSRIDNKQNDFFNVLSIMGGSYKSKTLGMEFLGSLSSLAMADGTQYFIPIYLSKADTIKGINFYQRVQGAYTADNYNGVALYSYSGGTITLIDTTLNNGNLWKGTANTWQSADFVNKIYCQQGLYFVSLLYNTSLQSTGPSIQSGGSVGGTNFPQHPLNTIRIYSTLASRATPISSQSLTSTTAHQNNAFILIY